MPRPPLTLSTVPGRYRSAEDIWTFLLKEAPRFTKPRAGQAWTQRTPADLAELVLYLDLSTPEDWYHLADDDLTPLFYWFWCRPGHPFPPDHFAVQVNARMAARARIRP